MISLRVFLSAGLWILVALTLLGIVFETVFVFWEPEPRKPQTLRKRPSIHDIHVVAAPLEEPRKNWGEALRDDWRYRMVSPGHPWGNTVRLGFQRYGQHEFEGPRRADSITNPSQPPSCAAALTNPDSPPPPPFAYLLGLEKSGTTDLFDSLVDMYEGVSLAESIRKEPHLTYYCPCSTEPKDLIPAQAMEFSGSKAQTAASLETLAVTMFGSAVKQFPPEELGMDSYLNGYIRPLAVTKSPYNRFDAIPCAERSLRQHFGLWDDWDEVARAKTFQRSWNRGKLADGARVGSWKVTIDATAGTFSFLNGPALALALGPPGRLVYMYRHAGARVESHLKMVSKQNGMNKDVRVTLPGITQAKRTLEEAKEWISAEEELLDLAATFLTAPSLYHNNLTIPNGYRQLSPAGHAFLKAALRVDTQASNRARIRQCAGLEWKRRRLESEVLEESKEWRRRLEAEVWGEGEVWRRKLQVRLSSPSNPITRLGKKPSVGTRTGKTRHIGPILTRQPARQPPTRGAPSGRKYKYVFRNANGRVIPSTVLRDMFRKEAQQRYAKIQGQSYVDKKRVWSVPQQGWLSHTHAFWHLLRWLEVSAPSGILSIQSEEWFRSRAGPLVVTERFLCFDHDADSKLPYASVLAAEVHNKGASWKPAGDPNLGWNGNPSYNEWRAAIETASAASEVALARFSILHRLLLERLNQEYGMPLVLKQNTKDVEVVNGEKGIKVSHVLDPFESFNSHAPAFPAKAFRLAGGTVPANINDDDMVRMQCHGTATLDTLRDFVDSQHIRGSTKDMAAFPIQCSIELEHAVEEEVGGGEGGGEGVVVPQYVVAAEAEREFVAAVRRKGRG